jgi:hypothetical protein
MSIPHLKAAFASKGISGNARLVLLALANRASDGTGRSKCKYGWGFAGYAQIMLDAGIKDRDTLTKAISTLVELKVIKRKRRMGSSSETFVDIEALQAMAYSTEDKLEAQLKVSPRLRKDVELKEYANTPSLGVIDTQEPLVFDEVIKTGETLGSSSQGVFGCTVTGNSWVCVTPEVGAHNPKAVILAGGKVESKEVQPKPINGFVNEFFHQEEFPKADSKPTDSEPNIPDDEIPDEITKLTNYFAHLLDREFPPDQRLLDAKDNYEGGMTEQGFLQYLHWMVTINEYTAPCHGAGYFTGKDPIGTLVNHMDRTVPLFLAWFKSQKGKFKKGIKDRANELKKMASPENYTPNLEPDLLLDLDGFCDEHIETEHMLWLEDPYLDLVLQYLVLGYQLGAVPYRLTGFFYFMDNYLGFRGNVFSFVDISADAEPEYKLPSFLVKQLEDWKQRDIDLVTV